MRRQDRANRGGGPRAAESPEPGQRAAEVGNPNQKLDTDPRMVAGCRQMAEAQRASDQEAYTGRLAGYARRWPADPKALVARRLREFLDISTAVDFDAGLVPAGKLMRFADPRYERKPPSGNCATAPAARPSRRRVRRHRPG
jgi:hypothetical protein